MGRFALRRFGRPRSGVRTGRARVARALLAQRRRPARVPPRVWKGQGSGDSLVAALGRRASAVGVAFSRTFTHTGSRRCDESS
jgi:hypothetical protein